MVSYDPFPFRRDLGYIRAMYAHAEADRPLEVPRDRAAVVAGTIAFLIVMSIGAALYLVEFQVAAWIQQTAVYVCLVALGITFKFTQPSSRLTPLQRRIREGRRAAVLVGGLGAAASLGLAAAVAALNSRDDWIFLGSLIIFNFGIAGMINVRFSMGKG
ncbi:MAG: hypothetical protein EON87_20820 [Brevundimonas sp.]|nr:MAG: hypothetical protein EON87_20820 [Brevundimonas sp.]